MYGVTEFLCGMVVLWPSLWHPLFFCLWTRFRSKVTVLMLFGLLEPWQIDGLHSERTIHLFAEFEVFRILWGKLFNLRRALCSSHVVRVCIHPSILFLSLLSLISCLFPLSCHVFSHRCYSPAALHLGAAASCSSVSCQILTQPFSRLLLRGSFQAFPLILSGNNNPAACFVVLTFYFHKWFVA